MLEGAIKKSEQPETEFFFRGPSTFDYFWHMIMISYRSVSDT